MTMKKKVLIICGIAAMLLAGCTKSNIVTGGPAEPVFETQEGIVLDWGQIGDDLDEQYLNNEDYPKAVSINYSVDPDKKTIDLTLMMNAGATTEEAVDFANAVVRTINDEAAVQDFSIETSTEDSYGGFFQDYTLNLIVMPDGMMTDKSVWLVNMTIPAGSNEAIVPAEGAKVMEPTSAEDEMGEDMDGDMEDHGAEEGQE